MRKKGVLTERVERIASLPRRTSRSGRPRHEDGLTMSPLVLCTMANNSWCSASGTLNFAIVSSPGPFPCLARVGDLGPNEDSPLVGTWQVAFLGEIEPRAARPGMLPRRVRRVGLRKPSAVKSPRWPPLSQREALYEL